MKIVVAIEGIDGAGKSSLIRFMQKLCQEHGEACTRIARRGPFASPLVSKLTVLLNEEARNLAPPAEVFTRIGREFQRAHLATLASPGLIVLDRFVLTLLSLARVLGQPVDFLMRPLQEIIVHANLHATIFVHCPFEVAYSRAQERRQGLTRRNRDQSTLRSMARFLEEEFHRGILTRQQWRVDNANALKDAEDQVAGYLLPYLQKP